MSDKEQRSEPTLGQRGAIINEAGMYMSKLGALLALHPDDTCVDPKTCESDASEIIKAIRDVAMVVVYACDDDHISARNLLINSLLPKN